MEQDMNNELEAIQIMDLKDLLTSRLTFQQFYSIARCLDYNPLFSFGTGTLRPLKEWEYSKMPAKLKLKADAWEAEEKDVDEIITLLLDAATPLWGSKRNYREVLHEIAEHLEIKSRKRESYDYLEKHILGEILKKAMEKIASLPKEEKEKFEAEFSSFLQQQGIELGGAPALDYLKASAGAGAGAVAGTYITTGIILSNLGIYHAALFTVGLWSVPTMLIGSVIFAPLMAGSLVYFLGKHNFKKTIPCVAIIASIRQELILTKKT